LQSLQKLGLSLQESGLSSRTLSFGIHSIGHPLPSSLPLHPLP
jgi:hypothetical protein